MPPIFAYFLQGSGVICMFVLFYKLLLRNETFFKWSRWYFLGAVAASFLLPLIDVSYLLHEPTKQATFVNYIPDLSFAAITAEINFTYEILYNLLFAGIIVMTMRLVLQMKALVKLRKNKKISSQANFKIVELEERINPFSFFNEIYINPLLHTDSEMQEIIKHEQFHIDQKHTLDILLSEVVTIAFWFNPFAWVLKNELKQNLEYLTDKLVLQSGIDAKHYQYNLLKVSALQNNITTANHFYFLKLKNRIIMMNKKQTHPFHVIKFLLLVPIVALLLMAFTERKQWIASLQEPVRKDTVPTPPKPPVVNEIKIKQSVSPADEKQLPSDVAAMHVIKRKDENKVSITLKNGKKEFFDLSKPEDKKRLEQKYKWLADALAQPFDINPPVSPADVVMAPNPSSKPDHATAPAEYMFQERPEVLLNENGYYLSIADDNGECVVIVKDKSKKITEAIKLTDWDANKNMYEKKYGKLPAAKTINKVTVVAPNTDASISGPGNPYNMGKASFNSIITKTLIIIDGVEQPIGFNLNVFDPNNIASISILKDKSATTLYGEKGVNGVIVVTTKKHVQKTITVNGAVGSTITTTPSTFGSEFKDALYIVDGKEMTAVVLKQKINPEQIKSISILKGNAALVKYGDKGKNGVIEVELKK